MLWLVVAAAATPVVGYVSLKVSKAIGRWLIKALDQTWRDAVIEVVAPEFQAVHVKFDELRDENERDHKMVRERLDKIEKRMSESATSITVNNLGGTGAQG